MQVSLSKVEYVKFRSKIQTSSFKNEHEKYVLKTQQPHQIKNLFLLT